MSTQEQQIPRKKTRGEIESEKRAESVMLYIAKIVELERGVSPEKEKAMRDYFQKRSPRERADMLFEKMVAYTRDKQEQHHARQSSDDTLDAGMINNSLISEIKILFEDDATKKVFSAIYSEAVGDANKYRVSDLGKQWRDINTTIQEVENEFHQYEQNLFLKKIKGAGNISATQSNMQRLAAQLLELKEQRESLLHLENVDHIEENTDAAAQFQYETFKRYHDELDNGFVWLPTRETIHQDTIQALQNGRWPVLIGEAGTGKSDQADAAAIELTGHLPTYIECETNTGEKQLIADKELDENGVSYESYGPLMQAFTGYENSKQKAPSFTTGRICRFDESGRLGEKAYAIIKKARQVKPGELFYGRPMLPGAAAIWTSNPVGPRYPDRRPVDPAMRREIAEIQVDYPEMSAVNPEPFDFMVSALLDNNGHIAIAEEELAPKYVRRDCNDDEKVKLNDGSVVVAKDELVQDPTDPRHGTLYRLAGAIKALQNSFVYGNDTHEDTLPDDMLQFTEHQNGEIEITEPGEKLTLSSSTITLGEMQSWMKGFAERLQKQNRDFQTETFSEWIALKIKTYMKQVDRADRKKVEAIFNHFHLFGPFPHLKEARPITPQAIGYLSTRVPRPLIVERPIVEEVEDVVVDEKPVAKERVFDEITLRDGMRLNIDVGEGVFKTVLSDEFKIRKGKQYLIGGKLETHKDANGSDVSMYVGGEMFRYAGSVVEEGTKRNGKIAGSLFNATNLHDLHDSLEVELGVLRADVRVLDEDVASLCKEEAECAV